MTTRRNDRNKLAASIVFTVVAAACASSDKDDDGEQGCPARSLPELCQNEFGGCPSDEAKAGALICSWSLVRGWTETPNDCGGHTLASRANLVGMIYHFDSSHKLTGGSSWSDVKDHDDCPSFGNAYGHVCKETGEPSEHDCP
jgi:hypothetical protein